MSRAFEKNIPTESNFSHFPLHGTFILIKEMKALWSSINQHPKHQHSEGQKRQAMPAGKAEAVRVSTLQRWPSNSLGAGQHSVPASPSLRARRHATRRPLSRTFPSLRKLSKPLYASVALYCCIGSPQSLKASDSERCTHCTQSNTCLEGLCVAF